MKKIFVSLFVLIFVFSLFSVSLANPLIIEQKWIISGANRSIYLIKLDGSDREIIFDKVADENSKIEVLDNSYNGKIILCKVVSNGKFSYWLVDLDKNEQFPIVKDLKFRPSNTIISKDGNLVSFTTTEKGVSQIWLYDVLSKKLEEFGKNVTDGLVRFVRFSYDGNYALYIKLTGNNRNRYLILCLRDFTLNKDYELTTWEDGNIEFGEFYFDNQNILITRILPGDENNSLWDFNIKSKKFTYITEVIREDISAISISRDGDQIAICSFDNAKPGKLSFWTLKKSGYTNLKFINEIPDGLIGIRLSHDGKYLLYSTENSPTYIASVDGSINEDLSSLVTLPNLKDANWYNHPPFPPEVTVKADGLVNEVSWNPANTGTYEIAGYKIYRTIYPDKKNLFLLADVKSTETSYIDIEADPEENYYYLVRSYDTDLTESLPSNHALLDRTPPKIQIVSPVSGFLTNQPMSQIVGRAEDFESGIDFVTINGNKVTLNESGGFNFPYLLLEGQNKIIAEAFDRSDNQNSFSIQVDLDSVAPNLQIDFPTDKTELLAAETNVRGSVMEDGSGIASFTLNSAIVHINLDESFIFPITIEPGINNLHFDIQDKAGNRAEKILQIKGVKKVIVILTIGSDLIIVNDIESKIDAPPFIDESSKRTMIPARFVVEPIGGTIDFDSSTQKITILRDNNKIELWIGNNKAIVNGKEVPIDLTDNTLAPRIENDRTYLPLRFIAENIGFLVDWNPITHQIKLTFPSFI